ILRSFFLLFCVRSYCSQGFDFTFSYAIIAYLLFADLYFSIYVFSVARSLSYAILYLKPTILYDGRHWRKYAPGHSSPSPLTLADFHLFVAFEFCVTHKPSSGLLCLPSLCFLCIFQRCVKLGFSFLPHCGLKPASFLCLFPNVFRHDF